MPDARTERRERQSGRSEVMAKRVELEQTAFLYGGNGAFIEDLYARYLRDPAAIDPSWRGYFDELGPDTRALFEQSRSALQPRAGGPRSAGPAGGRRRRRGGRSRQRALAPGDHRPSARGDADPGLSGARPSAGRPRPARPRRRQAPPRARPQGLRLHRCRPRARVLPRQRARPREGDPPPHRRDPAPDLQRQDRRRVHAHPGSRPEGLDPGAHGGHATTCCGRPARSSTRSSSSW